MKKSRTKTYLILLFIFYISTKFIFHIHVRYLFGYILLIVSVMSLNREIKQSLRNLKINTSFIC